ncbi:hypothetical protein M3906_000240 [Vibrio metschnikovii]|nr:hypothetical protein [Vibrio metschnikovii]
MSNEDIIANLTKKLEQAESDKAEILEALDAVLSIVRFPNQSIDLNARKVHTIAFKARKVLEKYSHD